MLTKMKMLAVTMGAMTMAVSAPAVAATYNISDGTSLNASFTTSATGVITSVTGTFLGSSITGLIADPFSPDPANYSLATGSVTATTPTSTLYYYAFDNLLVGEMFDNNGILFKTSANLVNLYNNAGTMGLIYSPIGSDVDATTVVGTPTVTAAVAAVPEPATWAMMIVGMGTIGFAMRRKTSRPASSSPEGRIPRA